MYREILLASAISALWLSFCFVVFGFAYGFVMQQIGIGPWFAFENSLGHIEILNGISLPRSTLWVYGIGMLVACIPINMYWVRRLEEVREES